MSLDVKEEEGLDSVTNTEDDYLSEQARQQQQQDRQLAERRGISPGQRGFRETSPQQK